MKYFILIIISALHIQLAEASNDANQYSELHLRKYSPALKGNHTPSRSPILELIPFDIYWDWNNKTLIITGDYADVISFYIINDVGLVVNQGIAELTSGNCQISMKEVDSGKYSLIIKYCDNYYIGDFNL